MHDYKVATTLLSLLALQQGCPLIHQESENQLYPTKRLSGSTKKQRAEKKRKRQNKKRR